MPKKNRIAIYELLFKEGVMVAKKDVHLAKHPELADKNVPNLHVMKAMQVRVYSGTLLACTSESFSVFLKISRHTCTVVNILEYFSSCRTRPMHGWCSNINTYVTNL